MQQLAQTAARISEIPGTPHRADINKSAKHCPATHHQRTKNQRESNRMMRKLMKDPTRAAATKKNTGTEPPPEREIA